MSDKSTLHKVDVLLVDSDLNSRQGVRTILNNNGYREITIGTELAKIRQVITTRIPDILLCGTSFPDGSITELLRDIRHNRIGNNPFMPVIMFLDEPTPELVADIMSAGPDDVVMKPISTKALLDRLDIQIHNRKPYIVTEDYVGPARKGDDVSRAIKPPNPLNAKATGGRANFHDIANGIEVALQSVNERRLENLGPEIAALVGRLGPMLDKPTVSATALGGLHMLIELNESIMKKLAGSRYDHVSELCRAMIKVSQQICGSVGSEPDRTQVKLLKPLSQAIQAGFSGGINNSQVARQIVERIGVKYD